MKDDPTYWEKVKQHAHALKGDGCTDSPDFFYRKCCDEHDIAYRTGKNVDGDDVTRKEADNELFKCMCDTGKTPIVGRFLIPALYWGAVRLFGSRAWKGDKAMSDPK